MADLGSADMEVRIAAARRAGATGHALLLDPLRALLLRGDVAERAAAADALGDLGVPNTLFDLTALIGTLTTASSDGSDTVAGAALRALGRYPFPEVRRSLMERARDPKASAIQRELAAQALSAALDGEATARFARYLEVTRREAEVARTTRALDAAPAQVRWNVAADSILFAARALLSPERGEDRAAARILSTWPKAEESLPFLIRALAQKDPQVRRLAASGLSRHDLAEARAALAPALGDGDMEVRLSAIEGVTRSADAATMKLLVGRLPLERDAGIRRVIVDHLKRGPPDPIAGELLKWPADVPPAVERDAIELASVLDTPQASTVLVKLMMEADADSAAQAKKHLDARSIDEVLLPLAQALQRAPIDPRRVRIVEAMAGRDAPEITEAFLAAIEGGWGDRSIVAALADRPEELVRPRMIAAVADDASRELALEAIQEYRGADVVEALSSALMRSPEERLFALLVQQPSDLTVAPMLQLLQSAAHSAHHARILQSLEGRTDERIPAPVAQAAIAQPGLASRAIAILKAQQSSSVRPALVALADAQSLPENDRADAVRALGGYPLAEVEPELKRFATAEAFGVRRAARNTLHDLAPHKYPSWDPYGRIPLIVEGSGFGAVMMLIAADLAGAKLSPFFTAGVGLVLGGSTPFLLTLNEDVTLGDAGYFGTVGLWSTLGGWGLGRTLHLSAQDTRWMTLGAEVLGVTLGAVTMKWVEWGLDDVAFANFSVVEVGVTTAALHVLIARNDDLRSSAFAGMIGTAAATIPAAFLSRRLQVEDDLALLATTMVHGAWIGAWVPGVLPGGLDAKRAAAGAAAGQGIGYLTGLIWAQFGDLTLETAAFSGAGAAIGSAAFGGLGLAIENRGSPLSYGLLAGGSAAGALTLGLLEPYLEFGPNDAAVIVISTLGGALAGADLSVRLEEKRFDEPSFPGGIMLGAGVGAAAGLLISQLTDVSNTELWTTLGGGALFAVGGTGFGLMVPDLDVRNRGRVSSAFIASGLALSYPFAEKLDLSGPNVAYMGVGAAMFGLWASFLPHYWHDGEIEAGKYAGGGMMGASIGAASTLALAQALDFNGGDVLLSAVGAVAGSGIGAGLGFLIPSLSQDATIGLMQGVGLAGFAAMTGLLASDLVSPRGSVGDGGAVAMHSFLFAAQGAWQGGLIPFLWRNERPPAEEIAGGVIVGTSIGALAGLTAIHLLDRPLATIDMIEATAIAGVANGIGAGVAIASDDWRVGTALMEGLGLGAYATALVLAPFTHYEGGAVTLVSAPPLFGWFGFWLPHLFEETPRFEQRIGSSIAAASVGALAGAAFVQLREDRDEGELWIAMLAGTGIGAGVGGLFAERNDRRTIALMEGGGVLALSTLLVLSPYTEYSGGDIAMIALGAIAGAGEGLFLPGLIHDSLERDAILYGSALGTGLGVALSMTLAQLLEPDAGDVLETGLLTMAAGSVGGGLSLMASEFSERETALAVQISALAGLVTSALVAPYTEYTGEDGTMITLMSAAGAWHGSLAPAWYDASPDAEQRAGGALLGAGMGSLLGAAVGHLRPLEYGDQLETAIYAAAGNSIGGGFSYLLDVDRRERAISLDAAGLSALALGIAISPYTEFSLSDVGLVSSLTAIGAWNGLWLPGYFGGELEPREIGGGAMLGAGTGMLAGVLVSQLAEIGGADQAHAYLTFAVGSGIGAGLGLLLPELDRSETLVLMKSLGGVGLIAGLSVLTHLDYEGGDFALVPLGAFLGGALGLTLPTFVHRGEAPAIELGGGALLGAGLGAVTTAAIAQLTALEATDVWEAGAFSASGALLGIGLGLAIPGSDRRTQFGLMDGLTVAGLGTGIFLAPYTDYDAHSVLNLGLGSLIGGAIGSVTPVLYSGRDIEAVPAARFGGGAMLGTGLGLAAGLVMDQAFEIDGDTRENIAIGALTGALSGAGIGLAASSDDRWAAGLAGGLTLAGAAGVGATAKKFRYDWGDVALGTAYVGYLTWHTSGLTLLLDGTDRQAAGVAMSTIGLGAITGMYLTPYLDLDLADVLMLLAGNVWGTWIGGWGGEVFKDRVAKDLEGRRGAGLTLLASVLGSDVGITVAGLVVGGLLDVPPMQFAVINLSGLGGMMIGMLTAGFAKGEPLKEGNVIGALSGLILGAVVTSFFDWKNATSWDQLLDGAAEEPAEEEEAALKRPKPKAPFAIQSWFPSATVQPGLEGEEQYLFTVLGTFE